MTLPLEQSMERERAKPIEEMARAIYASHAFNDNHDSINPGFDGLTDDWRAVVFANAHAAFACLVSHGFITIEGLLAMKAETDSQSPNGEARSSLGKG